MNAQTTKNRPAVTNSTELDEGTAAVIAKGAEAPKGKRAKSIFEMQRATVSEVAVAKMQLLGEIRQQLAQAAELVAEQGEQSKEVTEISQRNAAKLYAAMRDEVISRDELNGLLGDVFGYKETSKGQPSKTPNPAGEAIRKRVIRTWKAHAVLTGKEEPDRFFDNFPEDQLEEIVQSVNDNSRSIWTAYDDFADVKRDNTVRLPVAFDPNRIGKIVESLSENGAAGKIAKSPALVTAYAALIDVLNVVGQEAAQLADAE